MKHEFMPYLLPVITLAILIPAAFFFRPGITGLAIAPANDVQVEIRITAQEIIPEQAQIRIFLEDANSRTQEIYADSMRNFVGEYTIPLAYEEGANQFIAYEGFGYLGDVNVTLTKTMQLTQSPFVLKTQISYNETILSQTEQSLQQ